MSTTNVFIDDFDEIETNLLFILKNGQDDDSNSLNSTSAGAAKPVNPSSLFTSEGLQVSYQDLDKIFDNSDESNDNDTVSFDTKFQFFLFDLKKKIKI